MPRTRYLSITGYNRRDGSLAANGGISIDGGVLYVDGDLVLKGKFAGTGPIFVVGSTTITPSGKWDRTSGKQLLSKGPIEIRGR